MSMAIVFILALPFKGISDAITQTQDVAPSTRTAFLLLALFAAVCMCAGLILLAPWLAASFDMPGLTALLPLHSLVIAGTAAGVLHDGIFQRGYQFDRQAKRKSAGGLCGLVAGLTWAILYRDAFALVAFHLVGTWAATAAAWLTVRPELEPRLGTANLRLLLPKVAWLSASHFVAQLNQRGIDLVVGFFLGAAQVGLFRIALQLINLVTALVVTPFTNVLLAFFSDLRRKASVGHPPANFTSGFMRIQGLAMEFILPLFIYAGLAIPYLVSLVLGDEWELAGETARIVSVNGVAATISIFATTFLTATGHVAYPFRINMIQLLLTAATALFFVHFGLLVLAWAFVVRGWVATFFTTGLLRNALGISRLRSAGVIRVPMICTSAGASAFLVVEYLIEDRFATGLLTAGAAAALVHVLVAATYFSRHYRFKFGVLRSHLNGPQ